MTDKSAPPRRPPRIPDVRLFFWILSPVLALFAVLTAGYSIYVFTTSEFPNQAIYGARITPFERAHFAREYFIFFAVFSIASCLLALLSRVPRRVHHSVITELRADSLSERAAHATSALQEATRLAHELTDELTARSALLEDVKRQLAEANQHAEEMRKLAQVDDETTDILNRYFDDALKTRLGELEKAARRREWGLAIVGGMIVGLIVGVGSILIAHFLFGF